MVAEAVLYKLVEVITLHSWCYVWVCVPFAPLSHDSCCTSSGFCFVWSVCGLALLTVNAEFVFFYHCLKATSLNSMGGHHIFTNVHSSIMSCPYNAGFFLRTVSQWDSEDDSCFVFLSFDTVAGASRDGARGRSRTIPHTGGRVF